MEANNKYYIKLTAVTPLAVGAGNDSEWVKCADYVIKSDKAYILDLSKIAATGIDMSKLSMLLASNNHDGIINLIGNKIESVSARTFILPCETENNIKSFERSQLHDLPLVAGSSIKGALRSILFNFLRDDEDRCDKVFGKLNDGTDFMRFIKVGDIEMCSTLLYNTKVFNLQNVEGDWCGGWKHSLIGGTNAKFQSKGFNTLYECAEPGQDGYGTLMFSPLLFEQVLSRNSSLSHVFQKKSIISGGLNQLFSIINQFTRSYLTKEREFFANYPADRSYQILDSIDTLLSLIPNDNKYCLLKMSAGVGFHSITGDWQFEDYTDTGVHMEAKIYGKKKYKSRKIVEIGDGLSLMGFVRISEVDEAEYTNYRNQIDASFNERMKSIHEQKAAVKAKREEERLAQIEKGNTYAELIAKAQLAESACNYLMVIELAKQAAELYPNKAEAQDLISRNQKKATDQALEQQQAAAQAKADADKEKKAQGGLAALLNETYEQGPNAGKFKVVDFKVCLQKVSSWMKAANVQSLPEDQKRVLTEVIYRLLSNPVKGESKDLGKREGNIWKKVETLLSASQADELYNNYISK